MSAKSAISQTKNLKQYSTCDNSMKRLDIVGGNQPLNITSVPARPTESVTSKVKKNAHDEEPAAIEKVHNIIRNNLQVLQDDNSCDQAEAQHDHYKNNESEKKRPNRKRISSKKQVTILRPIRELV